MGISKEEKKRREELFKQGIKVCCTCKRELPLDLFNNNKSCSDGLSRMCRECSQQKGREYYEEHSEEMCERTKQWRENNPEKYKTSSKEYREKNKDKIKQYYRDNIEYFKQWREEHSKEYYERNKDRIIAYQKRYREEHPDICATRHARYYQEHAEELRQKAKVYQQEHLEEVRAKKRLYVATHKEQRKRWLQSESGKLSAKRSAHKRRVLLEGHGDFTSDEVFDALEFFEYKCAYTGESLEEKYHLDHIVPIVKGGFNYIWNIVPSNPGPNLSKHASDMEEWFRQQPYFSEERLQKIYEWINLQKSIKGEENYESRNIEEIA